jgi:hypothetical protein
MSTVKAWKRPDLLGDFSIFHGANYWITYPISSPHNQATLILIMIETIGILRVYLCPCSLAMIRQLIYPTSLQMQKVGPADPLFSRPSVGLTLSTHGSKRKAEAYTGRAPWIYLTRPADSGADGNSAARGCHIERLGLPQVEEHPA